MGSRFFFKRNVELEIMLPQKFSGCSIVGFTDGTPVYCAYLAGSGRFKSERKIIK